ncbi:hypothetical protein Tco_0996479, partial [Tanacetum coccineum]
LHHTREIKSITNVVVDQMHQPWRTFATIINSSLSGKTSGLDKLQATRKSKRVNRPSKKSTNAPTAGVIIRDTLVMSLSKKKEKIIVKKCKGNGLLSKVSLTKEAQYEEVCKKSLRDFHKTHPSGSSIVTSAAKIKPSIINKGTGAKLGVPDVFKKESIERSDSEHKTNENEMDYESDQEENEEEVEDKAEGDQDKGMDYTTNQFNDDGNERLNEPVNTNKGFIQKEGTDAEMINVQQGNENLEIILNQVIEDAHVTILLYSPHRYINLPVLVITKSSPIYTTVIPQSLPSFTPPPPQSTPTPPPTTKEINPLSVVPNFASVFQFNNRVSALENEVAKLKKDDLLNTQVTALVDEHLDSRLEASKDEFMSYLSASINARIIEQVKIQLPQILPKDVSNFAPLVIKIMVIESLKYMVLANESSQPQSTYQTEHRECYDGLIKSYDLDKSLFSTYDKVYSLKRSRNDKDKDEDPSTGSDQGEKKEDQQGYQLEFEVADSDMPQDQEENLGNDNEEPKRKVLSKRDWFTKPKQGPTQSWLMTLASSANKPSKTFDELMSTPIDIFPYIMKGLKITNLTQETLLGPAFKLLKGTRTNFAKLEYDFEECYKALSEKLY